MVLNTDGLNLSKFLCVYITVSLRSVALASELTCP
jgi:hypothetical protein